MSRVKRLKSTHWIEVHTLFVTTSKNCSNYSIKNAHMVLQGWQELDKAEGCRLS